MRLTSTDSSIKKTEKCSSVIRLHLFSTEKPESFDFCSPNRVCTCPIASASDTAKELSSLLLSEILSDR